MSVEKIVREHVDKTLATIREKYGVFLCFATTEGVIGDSLVVDGGVTSQ
ncbi:hypothetical protein RAAC3_TM7C00001G0879 [Candidatus Saccharibacteria bacterium RAAC3_TM7_1]|nr:hypothetical protein RAAC3_TM7C00001G0879 [Candidatus Saccharibacteria bacterium RAAC3_TM7_1]